MLVAVGRLPRLFHLVVYFDLPVQLRHGPEMRSNPYTPVQLLAEASAFRQLAPRLHSLRVFASAHSRFQTQRVIDILPFLVQCREFTCDCGVIRQIQSIRPLIKLRTLTYITGRMYDAPAPGWASSALERIVTTAPPSLNTVAIAQAKSGRTTQDVSNWKALSELCTASAVILALNVEIK